MKKQMLIALLLLTILGSSVSAEPIEHIQSIEQQLLPNQFLEGHLKTTSIAEVMLSDNIAGVSMAFIDNGKIAWRRTYGYAELSKLSPVTSQTVFAGASLSKPLTAVTAMQLVDAGKVSLDEDINNYLTSWQLPDNKFINTQPVTLRQLIGHRAGISNYVPAPYAVGEKVPTVTQMLKGESPYNGPGITLFSKPGEQYHYSNPGYTIIQQLIEDVTKTSFEAAVQNRVFEPLDMESSSFRQPIPASLKVRRATGYTEDVAPYPYQLFPFKGAGGVWTTPTDLATFTMALIDDYHSAQGQLVSQQIAREMFTRDPIRLGFKKHYVDGSNDIIFDHWGSIPGFTSYMVGSVQNKQALVIMTNSDSGFNLMAAIARTVAQQYGWEPIKPKVYQRYDIDSKLLPKLAGTFGKPAGNEAQHTFAVNNDQLHLTLNLESGTTPLVAVGDYKFIDPASNTTFEFLPSKTGEVNWVRVTLESGYNYDQPRQQTLTSFIHKRRVEADVEGLAVAVIQDGEVVFNQGFGLANKDTGDNISSQTLFEAASLSKPVFAYFTLLQAEKSVIELDQPLYSYLPHPDLAENEWHQLITARMLLTHTSGLPNWRSSANGKLSLLFKPGTQFQYSSEGYEYLRRVLQKRLNVDDSGLQALIDEQITHEIGADFIKYIWDDEITERKAFGHREGKPTDNHKHDHNFGASYSLITTAGNYAKFIADILVPDTAEKQKVVEELLELQTNVPHENGKLHRAIGFAAKQVDGRLKYYHSGNNGDFLSYVEFDPTTRNGVVIFSNSDKLFSSNLAKDIVDYVNRNRASL
ncbi:hypothetical protein C5610_12580 [Idiomarina sp. OT37-5b]|uniref:serine hydrolase domain-containing protein n=1 Tax=Idiomarina sp. OT37-5b TaxID=2100422 RepID=UPI000CF8565F|nr:serine hydrolase domain-containing protein [Idiomarina sp. OT37-5b]AVJ57045.1 hypothetical protein C5610_12580 [Idiomarina sp. OT37-5b]